MSNMCRSDSGGYFVALTAPNFAPVSKDLPFLGAFITALMGCQTRGGMSNRIVMRVSKTAFEAWSSLRFFVKGGHVQFAFSVVRMNYYIEMFSYGAENLGVVSSVIGAVIEEFL